MPALLLTLACGAEAPSASPDAGNETPLGVGPCAERRCESSAHCEGCGKVWDEPLNCSGGIPQGLARGQNVTWCSEHGTCFVSHCD